MRLCFFLTILLTAQTGMAVNTIDVSLEKGQLMLTPKHGGDGSAWGKSKCSTCHFKNRIHKEAPAIKGIVKEVGFKSCTGCHGQNGSDAERQCKVCHNEKKLPKKPILKGIETHDFNVNEINELSDKDCVTCHFSSDMDGVLESDVDFTPIRKSAFSVDVPYSNGVEFCLRCHNETHQVQGFEMTERFKRDPLVIIEKSYLHLDMHGYPRGSGKRTYSGLRDGSYAYGDLVECTDCHAMHGTHNKKLIVDRSDAGMTKLAPEIRELPVLIDVTNNDYSQLCVTCHSMDELVEQGGDLTGNGLSGVHEVGSNCTECHVHGLAAQTGL